MNSFNAGFYSWDDGTNFQFNSFAHNNHTQTCVYMYNNIWYDSECFLTKRVYVCKRLKSSAYLIINIYSVHIFL